MRPERRTHSIAALIAVCFFWSCGTTTGPDDDPAEVGSVRVTATTTGSDLDDSYSIAIGARTGSVSANGSATVANVPVGSASVQLGDIAANCAVTGSTSVSVTVSAGATSDAAFQVACTALAGVDMLLADALEALEDAMFAALNVSTVSGLDAFSFTDANDLFHEVLDLEAGNQTAAFGAAVTTVFMLEDDPDLRAAAEDWEEYLDESATEPPPLAALVEPIPLRWDRATLPLDFRTSDLKQMSQVGLHAVRVASGPDRTDHVPPPDVSGYRTLFLDVIVPALDEALDLMALVTDAGFTFTVTERMQGEDPIDADPLELDQTEVLFVRAGLEAAIASIRILTAYSYEPSPLGTDEFVTAMTAGSGFLELESDGGTSLAEALDRLRTTGDHVLDALDHLESETDDQSDDVIPFGPDGLDATDVADARSVVTDLDDALDGPTEVTIEEGETDEHTFTLDARQFFLNPMSDLKAVVPGYEVFTAMEGSDEVPVLRWTALNLDDWTFPDPTFNGVLPGMSDGELRSELGFGELFFELSLYEGYFRLITVDDVDCAEVVAAGGSGCAVGSDFYTDGFFDLSGGSSGPHAFIDLFSSSTGSTNLEGPYTVTAAGEGSYDLALDLTESGGGAVDLSAVLTDLPGWVSEDSFFRTRGGSTIEFTYLGSTWVFEKQE